MRLNQLPNITSPGHDVGQLSTLNNTLDVFTICNLMVAYCLANACGVGPASSLH